MRLPTSRLALVEARWQTPELRSARRPSSSRRAAGPGDQLAYGGRKAKHGGGKEGAYAIALIVALIIVIFVLLSALRNGDDDDGVYSGGYVYTGGGHK